VDLQDSLTRYTCVYEDAHTRVSAISSVDHIHCTTFHHQQWTPTRRSQWWWWWWCALLLLPRGKTSTFRTLTRETSIEIGKIIVFEIYAYVITLWLQQRKEQRIEFDDTITEMLVRMGAQRTKSIRIAKEMIDAMKDSSRYVFGTTLTNYMSSETRGQWDAELCALHKVARIPPTTLPSVGIVA
jgi:hypothetical protein